MRSFHARRAAMIGTAALLLVAPGASLVHAEPAAPALPADLVAAIQRDLGLTPAQYLDRAETGQKLASFADSIRTAFPESFAGAWLDASGTPLVGLADGPDKAAARTAVEVARYQVKDQPRNERTLLDQLGQLTGWIQNLPAAQSSRVNSATIDPVANDIALNVRDVADGSSLQLPDFLQFVRTVLGSALGSSQPSAASSTVTINPVTGATVGKPTTLTVRVNPAAAGGELTFEEAVNGGKFEPFASAVSVGDDGTATTDWSPETAGKVTIKVTFSGRDGVKGSTTTQEVTVAKGDSNPATTTITLDPIKGATVGKATTLKAKVNPAAAGGTVAFEVDEESIRNVSNEVPVGADGTATMEWRPENAGKATVTATFSGRDGVAGSTTTQQVTVAQGGTTTQPAADAIMGGDTYFVTDAFGESRYCSLGFNGTDGSGHAVVISAGHCDANPLAAGTPDSSIAHVLDNQGNPRFGTVAKVGTGKLDHAVIKIDDGFAKRFQNNYVRAAGHAPVPVTGTAAAVQGEPVCLSGSTTGYHCGTVKGSGGNNFTVAICGLHGDSGGALIAGTKALGIAIQTNGMESQKMCDEFAADPDISDFDKPTVTAVSIAAILKDNPGLKVRTN
ncbi:Ig-like domain repeat protein [Nocardia sp. NPDC059228]|uniref:Ig-like domain repeat protein n=1 Tax=Nocardia sp. NPDC059228 TaxID=3346777 RepID=UPI0036C058CA